MILEGNEVSSLQPNKITHSNTIKPVSVYNNKQTWIPSSVEVWNIGIVVNDLSTQSAIRFPLDHLQLQSAGQEDKKSPLKILK